MVLRFLSCIDAEWAGSSASPCLQKGHTQFGISAFAFLYISSLGLSILRLFKFITRVWVDYGGNQIVFARW